MNDNEKEFQTLEEFWPFYLGEHSNPLNRALHFIGSSFALCFLGASIYTMHYSYLIAAVLSGYGFAWIGHFFVQHNRPATFKYPLKSLISDWRMFYCILIGTIGQELEKHSIKNDD